MASIRDIAEKAGVSISTVSRTLNNYKDVNQKTKEKIFRIAKELNYFPNAVAKSLVQKRTYTIGMFFGNMINSGFDHPFFLDVISAVREIVGNSEYDLLIFTNKKKERATYTTLCRERSVDGVVLLLTGEGKKRTEQLTELQDSGIPCVAIDIPLEGEKCTYVESNNYLGAMDAMSHMIGLGHRRIAFIGGDEISKTSFERLRGYQDSLMKHQIGYDPSLVRLGYFSKEKAQAEAKNILQSRPDITAFFTVSDEMAIAIMRWLKSEGYQVPSDFSIVGFDDIREAESAVPSLTTVRQNRSGLGSEAARVLLQIIEGKEEADISQITLPCELIIRESTSSPRK